MRKIIYFIILFCMRVRNLFVDGLFINISGDSEIAKEMSEKIWRKK